MPPTDSPSNIAARAINSLQVFCRSESTPAEPAETSVSCNMNRWKIVACFPPADWDCLSTPLLLPTAQLESSEMLPGNDDHANDQQQLNQQAAIQSLTVRVNQKLIELPAFGGLLKLDAGDEFEVVNLTFDSVATQGVFAAEGYVNKLQDESSASRIDYNDGRFSNVPSNFAANGSAGNVRGLSGSWIADAGWDRLTLVLMHYQEKRRCRGCPSTSSVERGRARFRVR